MQKRIGLIDLMRFLFALIIVIFHGGQFYGAENAKLFALGYIGVEFFFIVSGFLMAKRIHRSGDSSTNIAETTIRFVWKKYLDILPIFIVALITSFTVHHVVIRADASRIINDIFMILPELFCLQMLGFPGYWASGVSWYLSAMFVSMLILYPIIYKWKNNATFLFLPLLAIAIYGYFAYNFSTVNNPATWLGLMYKGIPRAIAGLSFGVLSYEISTRYLSKITFSTFGITLLSFAEIIGYIGTIVITGVYQTQGMLDYLMILLLFTSITITFSQKSYSTIIQGSKITDFLGRLSVLMFLNHYYWAADMSAIFPGVGNNIKLMIYLSLVLVTSLMNHLIVVLLSKLKITDSLKTLIIRM